MKNQGTPKNLNQAIQNGLSGEAGENHEQHAAEIAKHVKDFMAQKFQLCMLRNKDLEPLLTELFHKITGDKS